MRRRRSPTRAAALLFAACAGPLLAGGQQPPRDAGSDALGAGVHPFYRKALQAAIDLARVKLRETACQDVLGDFVDRDGRPLFADLAATGASAADFLSAIRFLDGRWTGPCASGELYAWTHPGSRAVTLCLERFAQLARTNPSAAANILIHEELHALGLGEDPPTSRVITSRVGLRCGK